MEPIDTYLLAIGNRLSSEIISALSIDPKYLENVQNTERAEKREYLFIEVTQNTRRVLVATYVTEEEARIFESSDFKAIVNH